MYKVFMSCDKNEAYCCVSLCRFYFGRKKKEKYIHNLKCIGRKLNEKLRTINLDKNIYVSNETLSEARKHFSEDKVNLGIVR